MCQRYASILLNGRRRNTCPECGQKLRCETGCPTHGWDFAGGKGGVRFVEKRQSKANKKKIQLAP